LPARFAALLGKLAVEKPILNHGQVKEAAKVSTRRKICVKKAVKNLALLVPLIYIAATF